MPRGDGTGPFCGTKVKYARAVPCASIKCPNCGTMTIEWSTLKVAKQAEVMVKPFIIVEKGKGILAAEVFDII